MKGLFICAFQWDGNHATGVILPFVGSIVMVSGVVIWAPLMICQTNTNVTPRCQCQYQCRRR